MTTAHRAADRSSPAITVFDVPALPPLAAVRDRGDEAEERAALRREDGYVAGYQAGLDAARIDVERELDEHRRAAQRLANAAETLEAAGRDLAGRDAIALETIEHDVIALATALAEDLVGRELEITETPVLDALRRAVGLVPDRGTPLIRVHPSDDLTARDAVAADLIRWSGEVEVVGDPGIEPGGCVVEVGACRIDAQIGPALLRLQAASAAGRSDLLARRRNSEQSVA